MLHDDEPGVAAELDQHLRRDAGDRDGVVGDGPADELLELLGDLGDDPRRHLDGLGGSDHEPGHGRQRHPAHVHQHDAGSLPARVLGGEAQCRRLASPSRDADDDGP
jgi:hypothetical protein